MARVGYCSSAIDYIVTPYRKCPFKMQYVSLGILTVDFFSVLLC